MRVDRRSKLVGLVALLLAGSASAYVTPSPPPGFGGAAGAWSYTPPSAAAQLNGIMRGAGPSIAGAGETTAAYRLSAGAAARTLAGRAFAGLIPGVGVALAVSWLASNCFEKQGGSWVRTCGTTPPPVSTGVEYLPRYVTGDGSDWMPGLSAACNNVLNWYRTVGLPGNAQYVSSAVTGCVEPEYPGGNARVDVSLTYRISGVDYTSPNYYGIPSRGAVNCPAGWYITPAGCVQTPPPVTVTQSEVEAEMETKPLPQTLPPGVPYPLDPSAPSIWNPTIGDPATSQPLRVPQGNPVPVPNTDPQTYQQPVTRYTHSPTVSEPWRLDVQPESLPTDSPTGLTSPTSVTSGAPSGTPKEPDLCEAHPDIVACQKLGNLDALPVPNVNKQMAIVPDEGYGPSTGSCPQPQTAHILGGVYTFPWTLFCDFAGSIRPLMIGFAWLSAALTFMGLSRKD